MSASVPYKRPTCERVAPNRHMATAYRRAEVPTRKRPRPGGPLTSTEDVVVQAVKLGYKIADEQIAKGQAVARRLRGASGRADVGDVGDLLDQGMRLARQFAVLLVELTETTAHAPSIIRSVAKGTTPGGEPAARPESASEPAPSASTSGGYTLPVEVQSTKRTRVTLVLHHSLRQEPDVFPLYCRNPSIPPLQDVKIAADGTGYVLTVKVPPEQTDATYRGYAINRADGQPLGTIVVVVGEGGD